MIARTGPILRAGPGQRATAGRDIGAFPGGSVARTTAGSRVGAGFRPGLNRRLPLVGRDPDLALLDQALSVAEQGQLRAVLLLGDPGMGKTRLTAEVAARRHDIVTLSARAYPLGRGAGTAPAHARRRGRPVPGRRVRP